MDQARRISPCRGENRGWGCHFENWVVVGNASEQRFGIKVLKSHKGTTSGDTEFATVTIQPCSTRRLYAYEPVPLRAGSEALYHA
jgi:hypothetical protein